MRAVATARDLKKCMFLWSVEERFRAPVVMRCARTEPPTGDLPWLLLGVHSARLDVGTRDLKLAEALGLNCAWYADILMTLTAG